MKFLQAQSEFHPSAKSITKRWIDLVGSLVGLAFLAIAFLPIASMIKLDSSGSILYKQQRCGLGGCCFTLYKFRTMIENADQLKHTIQNEAKGAIFKNRNDPRITRVGRFLRRTSLDELPQFWNVLRGEMSLVGTRPPTPDEVAQYNERHWHRLMVKPGITGMWQVNGRSTIESFEEIVDLDLKYQAAWTPLYDLVLIWRTVTVLLLQKGAY
ncbi:sugar transferase [Leptolyngbya sp. AN03gr2]|uniref:sugar transferase n=1 Tax=unclassified Leptolyngbya TaxID=2650499 RepID=UPI003D313721